METIDGLEVLREEVLNNLLSEYVMPKVRMLTILGRGRGTKVVQASR
jgi:hypothetical protein